MPKLLRDTRCYLMVILIDHRLSPTVDASLSKLDACRPQLCAKLQLINGIEVLQVVAARIARCI